MAYDDHDAIVHELHVPHSRRLRRYAERRARGGYLALCSCGWRGPHTYDAAEAEEDRRGHLVGVWRKEDPWHR